MRQAVAAAWMRASRAVRQAVAGSERHGGERSGAAGGDVDIGGDGAAGNAAGLKAMRGGGSPWEARAKAATVGAQAQKKRGRVTGPAYRCNSR